jgi:uncharacterized protein YqgC (DUF456 family)
MKLHKETLRRAAYLLIAYFVAMAGLSIPAIPKHWFLLAFAVFNFGCAGYYAWLYKPKSASQPKPSPFFFIMFGGLLTEMAIFAWISPPRAPSRAAWFGSWLGILIALLLSIVLFEMVQRSQNRE